MEFLHTLLSRPLLIGILLLTQAISLWYLKNLHKVRGGDMQKVPFMPYGLTLKMQP